MVAIDVWIAGVVLRTGALGFVARHSANGVIGARIGHGARADALPISAALGVRAVAVGSASWRLLRYYTSVEIKRVLMLFLQAQTLNYHRQVFL